MKKLELNQIFGLAALAVGALVVGKIVRDVMVIRNMANEKEDLLLDADEDTCEEIEVIEADAEDVIEVAEEATVLEDAPICEEEIIPETAEPVEEEAITE